MNNMTFFLDSLFKIFEKNKNNIKENDINIFKIMFNGTEEVQLHSRFIAYLLSTDKTFLKLFLQIVLKLPESEFDIENCYIQPNEHNKSEYQEIDILIINEIKKQAIIIENKINAEDSIDQNEDKESGYRGQLERYYNTIISGKDKKGNSCRFKCDSDKTKVYYLSLYKEPSRETIGNLKHKVFNINNNCINYYLIQNWLENCLPHVNNSFLQEIIEQYLTLIKNMTTDNKRAIEITNLIAENDKYWESAYTYSKHLKDIKWHTIHRFFTELSNNFNTSYLPEISIISKVAHEGKKEKLVFQFKYEENNLQIVNDEKGFTIGNLSKGTWGEFSKEITSINFITFSNENTFHLINNSFRKEIVQLMKDEIEKMHQNDYSNLTSEF
ncbi:PD-(D/E)XK nuclease family protein [Myroides odoratimimus]|uniref:PD-(D/E)XK nuclease family protein n=2 Tax=Myroides odoratimimus TaxID=76832 RepID=UPI001CE1F8CF|nr:PD-(D/E)XK nuclease family protein [Myroides odoratimimus]